MAVAKPAVTRPRGLCDIQGIADAAREQMRVSLEEWAALDEEYWLIDPEPRTFEVLVRQADATYAIALVASEGQLSVPGCDGLVVDLDAMWAEIADFDDAE